MDLLIFKDRLHIAMKKAGINGADLSKLINASRSSICRYLKGERIPKADTLNKMSKVLGVSVFWLLGSTDEVPEQINVLKYNPIDYSKLTRANKLRIQGYYQALLDTQTEIPE